MTKHDLFIKKISHAVITEYEIELIVFKNNAYWNTYYKDLSNNRCYEETETTSLNSKFDNVKRRIKNSVFDEIMSNCQIAD